MRLFGVFLFAMRRIFRVQRKAYVITSPSETPILNTESSLVPASPVLNLSARTPLRFRAQICCDTGLIASLLVVPPVCLDGNCVTVLYESVQRLRCWSAGGFPLPRVVISLSYDVVESPALAQDLIKEINQLELIPDRVIFSAPRPAGRQDEYQGLVRLAQSGCGIELCCLDPMSITLLSNLPRERARLRLPPSVFENCHTDVQRGKIILSILALAERHHLTSIADEISVQEDYGLLAQLGCSIASGDAVVPVLDADATENFLREMARGQTTLCQYYNP